MRIAPTQPPAQKREPIDDIKYRKHVSQQPCDACGWALPNEIGTITQGAHISAGNYARGMKASDEFLIPLCVNCHDDFDCRSSRFPNQTAAATGMFGMTIDALKARAVARWIAWKSQQMRKRSEWNGNAT